MKSCVIPFSVILLFNSTIFAEGPEITISKETTFVTDPKTDDGFVDLITAINSAQSEGVSTESNAAAIIFPILGPRPDRSPLAARFYEELGVERPLEQGDYFISLSDYLTQNGLGIDKNQLRNEVLDQQGEAMLGVWRQKDYPNIVGWLDANEIPLKQIILGVQRPDYYCPINSDIDKGSTGQRIIGTLLPHIQSIREVSRALCCRAMLLEGEGKTEAAWENLLASYRLGRHIRKGPFLIDTLVGIAVEAISNNSMLVFLERSKPDAKLAAEYLKNLSELPEPASMAEVTNLSERLMFIDIVAMIAYDIDSDILGIEQGLPELHKMVKKSGSKVDWNHVLKNSNRWYDRVVEAMQIESYSKKQEVYAEIDKDLTALKEKFQAPGLWRSIAFALLDVETRSTYISDVLVALILPATKQASVAEYRSHQRFENLRVAIALAGYRAKNSSYPDRLEQLIPDFIEVLPTDYFAEKPLRYQKTEAGYLLYSIGSNRIDDGGKSFDEQKDDLVIRIPGSNP